jgi:hypothetical protein
MAVDMKFTKTFFLLVMIFTASYSNAIEILSKKESERTFNKSLNDWKKDSELLLKSGKGEVIIENEITVTMIVFVRNQILKISPIYKVDNLERPWKIAVGVEQNKELTEKIKALGNVGMRELANKWYVEMLPEYTLMTEFDDIGETLQVNFSIFEYGTNKIVDDVGRETLGCWEGCVKSRKINGN